MAEYKPVGSEKLNSDEKLKRILELTYYNRDNKNKIKTELVKESIDGGVYGIVKEKDGYYVKRGINESSLDYIGGMFMKNKNKFSSYSEALKRMELLRGSEINEATKYVLKKTDKQQQEAPAASPSMDMPPAEMPPPPPPADSVPTDAPPAEMPTDMPPSGSEGGETQQSKRSDYMAEIQKYAGKLGQELRDQIDRMESDDIKYVLNMIISAVDLDKLELEDLEDIGKKFERDEDVEGEPSPEDVSVPEEPESEEPQPETDLGEIDDPMMKLERFIDTDIQDEMSMYEDSDMYEDMYEDFDMYEDMFEDSDMFEEVSAHEMYDDTVSEDDDVVELDMNEIQKQISKSVNDTLSKYFK